MKLKLSCMFLILIAVFSDGCSARMSADTVILNLSTSPYFASQQNEDIAFSVKESTVSVDTNEITLIFENKSDIDYFYGMISYIEIESDGNWYSIPVKENVYWTMLGYPIPAQSSSEQVFPIHTYFDNLEIGKYRIVKKISMTDDPQNSSYIFAEFVVE